MAALVLANAEPDAEPSPQAEAEADPQMYQNPSYGYQPYPGQDFGMSAAGGPPIMQPGGYDQTGGYDPTGGYDQTGGYGQPPPYYNPTMPQPMAPNPNQGTQGTKL